MASNRKPKPKKPPLTHFLCLPLVNPVSRPTLEESISRFKDETAFLLRNSFESASIDRVVRPVGTLHLTLGVMSLTEEGNLEDVTRLLSGIDIDSMLDDTATGAEGKGASEAGSTAALHIDTSPGQGTPSVKQSQPLSITLKGLDSMGNPRQTSVLYALPVDDSNRLRVFCERLKATFVSEGLMVEENRPLKLHVTLLNTIYARPGGRSEGGPLTKPSDFNGRVEMDKTERSKQTAGIEDNEEKNYDGTAHNTDEPTSAFTGSNQARNKARSRGPLRFDARLFLDQFKEFEWAEGLKLDRIAICKMGAEKIKDEDGNIVGEEYVEIAAKKLPT